MPKGSLVELHPLVGGLSNDPSRFSGSSMYLYLLTFFGGIGGFLFGYDTGVISGALPFMEDDLLSAYRHDRHKLRLYQEVIVSIAVLAAAFGAATGGWLSDKIGRKKSLFLGDGLFFIGACVMASAHTLTTILLGRFLVGLGVGLASVTVPVYIAECSPVSKRASLVTINVLMITAGQFVSYLVNYMFTYVPGTWRWMLGVAGIPAVLQLFGLLFLPESPRWLHLAEKRAEASQAVKLLMPESLASFEIEMKEEHKSKTDKDLALSMFRFPEVRYELCIGIGLQVLQQLCGINTVMYYTPMILEMAGYADKRQALLMSLFPAFVNAAGTVVGIWSIDRYGRRRLLLASLAAVFFALCILGGGFYLDDVTSPVTVDSLPSGFLPTCSASNCQMCIQGGCSFCAEAINQTVGICLSANTTAACSSDSTILYESGCPSQYSSLIIISLVLYLMAFAPGLGPVPWAVNAEIYPLAIRGLAGGAAATANWLTNYVVSQLFLTIVESLGAAGAFWLYALISIVGFCGVLVYLPETKGLSLEEVQRLFKLKANSQWD